MLSGFKEVFLMIPLKRYYSRSLLCCAKFFMRKYSVSFTCMGIRIIFKDITKLHINTQINDLKSSNACGSDIVIKKLLKVTKSSTTIIISLITCTFNSLSDVYSILNYCLAHVNLYIYIDYLPMIRTKVIIAVVITIFTIHLNASILAQAREKIRTIIFARFVKLKISI